MGRRVKFMHIADLHIGLRVSRFDDATSGKIQEARFQALDKIRAKAKEAGVDFILIAGDLFDDCTVNSVDAMRVFELLKKLPIYIIPGNHDPYYPGSVWTQSPWNKCEESSIRVLKERKPVAINDDIILYPCPVFQKKSTEDPTGWMHNIGKDRDKIHLGIAHGSVMDREFLARDDHPIPLDCPEQRGLDYLALGHWHSHKTFSDGKGICRMAYPGTHERFGFGKESGLEIGWESYSSQPDRPEFASETSGALVVTIDKDRSTTTIEPVDVGQLFWVSTIEHVNADEQFEQVFSRYAQLPNPERTLLLLKISGVVGAEQVLKINALRKMLQRYLFCELDDRGLHIRPDDAEMEKLMNKGLLAELLKGLREKQNSAGTEEEKQVVEAAMRLAYELAKEFE